MVEIVKSSRKDHVIDCLNQYLLLGKNFKTPPQFKLELISDIPRNDEDDKKKEINIRDVVVATALQCYASGITILKQRRDEKSISLANTTLEGGHHTTRQHVHITWKVDGATRNLVHDILHINPFYNSEQQSQRYVEAKNGSYLIPNNLSEKQEKIYLESAEFSNKAYFDLLEKLYPEVEKRVDTMYPVSGREIPRIKDRLDKKIKKLTQEVARYVLPIAQKTTMDHTLSELQVLRLFRASQMNHFTDEAKYVVACMVNEIAKVDESILDELDVPIPFEKNSFNENYVRKQKEEFDQILQNNQSILLHIPEKTREILALSVRNILGTPSSYLSDSEALSILMDPSRNKALTDIYEIGIIDPLTSCLRQVSLTYATKLSHTADSQRQRHRRTPGATPPIEEIYDGTSDYATPLVIRENPELLEFYDQTMVTIYNNVEKAIKAGIPKEYALLLLPNAQNVRVVESGDLFDWIHRFKQRLCFLAQEEIFFISVEQVEQIKKIFPEAEKLFLAPCGIRKKGGINPSCPEDIRWCGKVVSKLNINEYIENRII